MRHTHSQSHTLTHYEISVFHAKLIKKESTQARWARIARTRMLYMYVFYYSPKCMCVGFFFLSFFACVWYVRHAKRYDDEPFNRPFLANTIFQRNAFSVCRRELFKALFVCCSIFSTLVFLRASSRCHSE